MGTAEVHEVPSELVSIRAYRKWEDQCRSGRDVHGYDKTDWLEAECEIIAIWRQLAADDLCRFCEWLGENPLVPDHDRVAVRAYFKSISDADYSPEGAERCWRESVREEKEILFAEAFDTFHEDPPNWTPSLVSI